MMKKNKPDAMIIDDFGNIYYSAASLNELKQKYKEELTLEKNAYNRMYNMYVEKDNIINELEKYINESKQLYVNEFGYCTDDEYVLVSDLSNKIKELKGDSSNGN